MAIAPADERNLILPLFAQLRRADSWDTFLKRLLARTGATRVCLLQQQAGTPLQQALQQEAWQGLTPPPRPLDIAALEQSGLMPLQSLRSERVYSLEEMRVATSDALEQQQKAVMIREDVRHARFVRFHPGTEMDAWLILVHDRKDFVAADSALIASVIPYLAVAMATLGEIEGLELRASTAEEALAMLGIGQAVLDVQGRPIVADAIAEEELTLRGAVAESLTDGCEAIAGQGTSARSLVCIDARQDRHVLLRPAHSNFGMRSRNANTVALVRRPATENDASAALLVSSRYGLSAREAALAVALCRGQSLIEAGVSMRLTRETARNYSKRIYAKTGASGQADLVRMILGDLMPFA